MWADHDVLAHTTGTKHLVHPLVGELTLDYVTLILPPPSPPPPPPPSPYSPAGTAHSPRAPFT
ncbi:MmyB family transcriptional regulator [Streptomyces kutzneri]|uniref:MmyB family transcriptional regulator n=1 Tax=Streptomyces kutzneri TaxID=3051179 RepID=UPI0028D014B0|nr:hypothetical protein [Streptomyces sp. DSM 40907]